MLVIKAYASGGTGVKSSTTGSMSHAERREYYRQQREANRIDYSGQPTPRMTTTRYYRSRMPGFDQYGRPMYSTMTSRGR